MQKKKLKGASFVLAFIMAFALCISIVTNAGNGAAFAASRPNSQYSLAGAQYQLYTDRACTTKAKDVNGNNAILTTDANGNTSAIEIETGNYFAKEIKASPGYRLDADIKTVTVTKDKTTEFTSDEPPAYGEPKFQLYKVDKSGKYGWRQLLGAEYTIKYYDVAKKDDISADHLMRSWTFKTKKMDIDEENSIYFAGFNWQNDEPVDGSDDFYEVDGERVIPLGWFTIEETKAPNGLALSADVYYGQVSQPSNGAKAKTTVNGKDAANLSIEAVSVYAGEDPQSVTMSINKQPAQEGADLVDTASLAGAEYNVYFDDPDNAAPELVGTITTDEEGKGKLEKREAGDSRKIDNPLDAGDYLIEEVKASPGFLIDKYILGDDGESTKEYKGDIEVIVDYDSNGTAVTKTISGEYKSGKHIFKARLQGGNTNVFNFTVDSKEYATETRFKKTDATTTKEIPGATIQIINKDGEVIEQWVSTTEEHIIYGLTVGETYTLREITAPYGYDIAEDLEFTVPEDKIVNKVEMQNKPIGVETVATDVDTETHHGTKKTDEKIKDTVTLTGLYEGRKYQVTGKLWNKTTGEFVKDAEGNDLTAESEEFTATGDKMEIEMFFTVDSSEFSNDTSLVAYEYLTRVERVEGRDETNDFPDEEFPKELGKHEDPEDEDQTVVYGGIAETKAVDGEDEDKFIAGKKGAVLKDTVVYENLSPKEEYTVKGELYDKTAGKLTGITATKKFRPEKADGSVVLEFKFDGTQYKGHILVAYETLVVNNIEVSKHEDPDDEDQTVEIPAYEMYKIRSTNATAMGEKYGFDPGSTVLYDVVIKNISATASIDMDVTDQFTQGKEYFTTPAVIKVDGAKQNTISSDKNKVNITVEAGKTATVTYCAVVREEAKAYLANAAKDSDSLDKDGNDTNKKYQANKTDDKDGYRNVAKVDNPVPTNPDKPNEPGKPLPPDEDEAQTPVKEPEIGTYLADNAGAKEIDPSGNTTLVDTVAYKGLTPGNKYAVIGELIVKDTKDPLVENGEPVRAVGVFIPEKESGTTEVEFVVNTKGLAGKQVVAFETAYKIEGFDEIDEESPEDIEEVGYKVAEHKNLRDEDQTIYLKAPGKPHAPKTGDDFMLFLIGGAFACCAALMIILNKKKRMTNR